MASLELAKRARRAAGRNLRLRKPVRSPALGQGNFPGVELNELGWSQHLPQFLVRDMPNSPDATETAMAAGR